MEPCKMLIIGAGITGSVVAFQVSKTFPRAIRDGILKVKIWEQERTSGGRMKTIMAPGHPDCFVDIGAQYISTSGENHRKFSSLYRDLEQNGVLEKMTAKVEGGNPYGAKDVMDQICPRGNSGIVNYFLEKSEAEFVADQSLLELNFDEAKRFSALSKSGKREDGVDCVIITIPIPQIEEIGGNAMSRSDLDNLKKFCPVKYSSRFAMALFFPDRTDIGLDFGFKFVDDEIIRYVAVDNIKRGRPSEPAAIALHSTWQFGRDFGEDEEEKVKKLLLDKFYQLFPTVPRSNLCTLHKWKYSQVRMADSKNSNSPGFYEIVPSVFVAGDGFTTSSLDGCFESAVQVSDKICAKLRDRFKLS